MKRNFKMVSKLIAALLFCSGIYANGITISNVTVLPNTNQIQFDISWENSWRSDILQNWDAAWVFMKYKDVDGTWRHVNLINNSGVAPAGYTVEVASDSKGAFLYRSAAGSGATTLTAVKLGVGASIALGVYDVKVFGIEMVYIPTAPFWIGDNRSSANSYSQYGSSTGSPSQINGGSAFFVDPIGGGLFVSVTPAYPTGYASFYCMKHEVSQAAYRDFLNTLTFLQQIELTTNLPNSILGTNAMTSSGSGRSNIKIAVPGVLFDQPAVYGCDANNNNIFDEPGDGEWTACNYISWCDLSTFLSWACLAPMTELQFEKICRGPIQPVNAEFAWGNHNISTNGYILNNLNNSNEIVSNPSAVATEGNAAYFRTNINNGPLRNGIFATSASNRISSGGSFYGVMEMSGNLYERVVTTANTDGRAFNGSNGQGGVSSTGFTSGSTWPAAGGPNSALGLMYRGGSINTPETELRVSNRNSNSISSSPDNGFTGRLIDFGGRGVRNL